MDTKVKGNPEVHIDEKATISLAYHEMCVTRHQKTLLKVILAWALSVVSTVAIFAWLWLQYDYVSTDTTNGVYVLSDSEGNVIASDLAPEDVIHIMELLGDGKYNENPKP